MTENKIQKNLYDDEAPSTRNKRIESSENKSSKDLYDEIDYGVSIKDSVVYLHGDIMLGNLFDFISKVRLILTHRPEELKTEPITLLLNTNGGDVYEALGIIDYMQTVSVPINVIARGRAMSAGAMILCAGTGLRAASKNTTIMVHEASANIMGKSADIKANAEHIDELEEDFYKLMAEKTNQNEEFWRKACRKDFYMTAEKAKELGLIDEVI